MPKWLAFIVAVLATFALGQQPPSANAPQPERSAQQKDKEKPNKDQSVDDATFSDAVANAVLGDIRDGLEGHSQRQMLSAFDRDRMNGYSSFQDQIQALFETYETFRVHYRIAQSTAEAERGIVLVDFEVEETPRGTNAPPQRRTAQLRFELERGKKGWKIVDVSPRSFFS